MMKVNFTKIHKLTILTFKQSVKFLLLFIPISILVIGFAVGVRIFILDIRYVPSPSMTNAIMQGDWILVEKLTYGPRKPRKLSQIPWFGIFFGENELLFTGRFWNGREPDYNEVVVFADSAAVFYVKRVIGISPDTVSIQDGKVYINNKLFPEKTSVHYYRNETSEYSNLQHNKQDSIHKKIDVFYVNIESETQQNTFFVMGDNRSFSFDSRKMGTIPYSAIDGKAVLAFSFLKFKIL